MQRTGKHFGDDHELFIQQNGSDRRKAWNNERGPTHGTHQLENSIIHVFVTNEYTSVTNS